MKSILHVSRTLRYGIAFPMIFFFDDETFIQSYIDFPSMLSTSPISQIILLPKLVKQVNKCLLYVMLLY